MRLVYILGSCLLLAWPDARMVLSARAAIGQVTQSQESSPGKASQQDAAGQQTSPADPQKDPNQSAPQPQEPTTAPHPCPATPSTDSTAMPDCKPAVLAKPKIKKHHQAHKVAAPTEGGPNKTVVRNGSTDEPTIDLSPGLTQQQAFHQRESTKQLLAAADENLKKISGRELSASQQDTVKQIKSYKDQANAATNGGDLQRAYNLAVKANLLSAELAGH